MVLISSKKRRREKEKSVEYLIAPRKCFKTFLGKGIFLLKGVLLFFPFHIFLKGMVLFCDHPRDIYYHVNI